ncbi:error-prone DNA polymerase [Hansschlegelia quercus]|uniref:Error-prone DNA polymerase n=1 Tax=Hansschlegelia quercus TaxID=2528245 RepID=A0A4Q9GFW8_9HYPH|nr:error-prone DNA polymerase [Hansschlegelia quercus]TBN51861.1 error-prone DNA polymerase [Hansschlegelia quercus]
MNADGASGFVELAATTAFSFLRSGSRPEEYVAAASFLGLPALGIADRNSVAGVVRAYSTLKNPDLPNPVKLISGARLVFEDGAPDIVVHPRDRDAWGRLCRLLSIGKGRAEKGDCRLRFEDLLEWSEGLCAIVMPPAGPDAETQEALEKLTQARPGAVWLGASMPRRGDDIRRLGRLKRLAARIGVPLLATNEPLYHTPDRRPLQDVLTCIREGVTLEQAGRRLEANAERRLMGGQEMERLFKDAPEAVTETARFAERIVFSLEDLRYNYPHEPVPPGKTAHGHLRELVREGMARFYPQGAPRKVEKLIAKELAFIKRENYAHYFLTVHDIVAFARSRGILCQGRGSAANSAVCYVLGVTAVDPAEADVLFERFLSKERSEPPDIDIDFEHERREDVIQHIYQRYGRERAALAATVIHYKPRSAIREVGKVFGLSEDTTAALANTVWGSWGAGLDEVHVRQAGLDPANPYLGRAVALASELVGFPRHLSQHVGGFVLTDDRLDESVPVGPAAMPDRSFIEWDKDDIDAVRMIKVDVLALGMLTCIRKAFDLLRLHDGENLELATVATEQQDVYAMLSRGDSLGVFQVESRAQMNMLPRLKPKTFYDLVVEVAIVRPGPIQGDMVHPYLKARQNPGLVRYPSPGPPHDPDELKNVLEKTLGVPLFQEQAMRIAMVAAKFSGEEANGLRRSMATFRHVGGVDKFFDKMVGRMIERGYDPEFAKRCFKQIEGFGSYGFPESHAASFAKLVYVSSYLKCRHPAAFACALLNSQPMGFYAPAEIVRDAREHGIEVRGPDVAVSFWDNTLEKRPDGALRLRLGFRQIDGFKQEWAEALVEAREQVEVKPSAPARGDGEEPRSVLLSASAFGSVEELRRRTGLPKAALVKLADADAFRSMELDRRAALWDVRRLPDDIALPLFEAADAADLAAERATALPAMSLSEHVVADYQTTRLSLKGHPVQFLRGLLSGEGAVSCEAVRNASDGRRLKAAGVVLVRQKPGSAKGVVFITIADETGVTNAVVWPAVLARFRREVMGARLLEVQGRAQRSPEGVVHLVAERLVDRTPELQRLSERELKPQLSRADEILHPQDRAQAPRIHPRDVRILPRSRDFH